MTTHLPDRTGRVPGQRDARGPRPVTPVGIAAARLASVSERLAVLPDVPEEVRRDLDQALGLVAGLDDYVTAMTSPPSPALAALEERTRAEPWGDGLEQEMLSGHVEGAFLQALVRLAGAQQVLEIGSFTGYASLAMAEVLPPHGRVVACELDPHVADVAAECLAASPAGARVQLEVGPALATLDRLEAEGACFDLVFLDADKAGYTAYLDRVLAGGLLAPRGVVAVDNTLLQGEPWAATSPSGNGSAVAAFNRRVAADPHLVQVLVPLRDGVTLVQRA